MLKHTCLLLAVLLTLAAGTNTVLGQGADRIAFVNMDQVFNEYEETKKFDARLKELADDVKAENDEMVAELEEMGEEFSQLKDEISDPALSDEARKRKRAEAEEMLLALREKQVEIQKFQEERRKELDDQGRRMRERIVKKINRVVKDYAEEKKFFAVIDSSGNTLNQIPVVIFSVPRADVTKDIIDLLNAGRGDDVLDDESDAEEAE
jgi:outer membrane protein